MEQGDLFHKIEAQSGAFFPGVRPLKGKKAALTYGNEEEHWTILAYGKKDRGLLVITKIDKDNLVAEKDNLDLMWNSLNISI